MANTVNRVYFFLEKNDVEKLSESKLYETFSFIKKITNHYNEKNVIFNLNIIKYYTLTREEFDAISEYICNTLGRHIGVFYKTNKDEKYLYSNTKPLVKKLDKPVYMFLDED